VTRVLDPVSSTAPMGQRVNRRQLMMLLAILAIAFALRIWGLSWGLPYHWSLDEVHRRDDALNNGIPNLTATQPGFVLNSLFVIYRVAGIVAPPLGDADSLYLARLFMVVVGVLTVLGVWMLARELADDDKPAVAAPAAALLVAVLPFQTAMSRYVKEDGPLGLMTVLVMLALVRYWKAPSWQRLALLGLAVGASFSTKFAAVALLPVIGLAVLAVAKRDRTPLRQLAGRICGLALAAGVGVLVISPQYLANPGLLWDAFEFQFSYSMSGSHDGMTIPISPWAEWWTYYIRHGLIPGMTWPVFLVAIAGAVPLWRRPAGPTVVAAAVLMYLVLEHSVAKPAPFAARYLTPVVPLLCVQAAFGIQALVRRSATLGKPVLGLVACAVVFVVPPTLKSMMIADEAVHDTRWVAGAWMDDHFPPGTNIATIDNHQYRPVAHGWDVDDIWYVDDRGETLDPDGAGNPAPYFVLSSFRYQRYLDSPAVDPKRTAYYRQVMGYRLVKEFKPKWLSYGFHSPTILIYQQRPPKRGRP
jgi:4-amino-4-deoxy-L-arabinose transferase-like glycosyltransferase